MNKTAATTTSRARTGFGRYAQRGRQAHRDLDQGAEGNYPEDSVLRIASSRVGAGVIDLDQLQKHIRTLVTLEETGAPMLSCYFRRQTERADMNSVFKQRLRALRSAAQESERKHLDEALNDINQYLTTRLQPATQGVALFARGGTVAFFLGLQFQVPLENRLSMGSLADIYPLVELKDTYDRYVVVIANEDKVRILEINLGAVTRDVWTEQPELRERVGKQWSREHYQNHRRDRGARFLKEKISLIERLMTAGGHTHLILAGSPRVTDRIRSALPSRLWEQVIDSVGAPANSTIADVVAATLSTFIEFEQEASLDTVAELVAAVRRGTLGAAGTVAALAALRHGAADVLVMAQSYQPGPAWQCQKCEWVGESASLPASCPQCASSEVRPVNMKETMVRLAERQSVEVELVEHSDALMALGGVGCLLRYATVPSQPSTP